MHRVHRGQCPRHRRSLSSERQRTQITSGSDHPKPRATQFRRTGNPRLRWAGLRMSPTEGRGLRPAGAEGHLTVTPIYYIDSWLRVLGGLWTIFPLRDGARDACRHERAHAPRGAEAPTVAVSQGSRRVEAAHHLQLNIEGGRVTERRIPIPKRTGSPWPADGLLVETRRGAPVACSLLTFDGTSPETLLGRHV